MPKDDRERVNLSMTSAELTRVDRMLSKSPWKFQKRSAALKSLILYVSENTALFEPSVTERNRTEPNGTGGLPKPGPAEHGTEVALQSPQKEEKKKNREKKEKRLAPLDLSQRILDDLNKRAGSNFQAHGKVARQNIAARLAEGFTEVDFYEVHRKMSALWLGTDMAQYLNYETLYGNKFAKYLGQPEPTAKPTQGSLAGLTEADWTAGCDDDGVSRA